MDQRFNMNMIRHFGIFGTWSSMFNKEFVGRVVGVYVGVGVCVYTFSFTNVGNTGQKTSLT